MSTFGHTPWIFAGLTVCFWVLGRFGIEWPVYDSINLLNSLIFLDSVHILFTYVLWRSAPELRQWTKTSTGVSDGQKIGPVLSVIGHCARLWCYLFFVKGSTTYAT